MIVRINQFDLTQAEQYAGWASVGLAGPVAAPWPQGTGAYEVLILEADEKKQPLARTFRQMQLRQLIPEVLGSLIDPGEQVVVRLDGPMEEGQLLRAFHYLTDPTGAGRFCVGTVAKFNPDPHGVIASVRLAPTIHMLLAMCGDSQLGLERSVRMRAFTVPEEFVNPLLDTEAGDDERWPDLLEASGVVLSTARTLGSLQLFTRRYSPQQTRERLMRRLTAKTKPSVAPLI